MPYIAYTVEDFVNDPYFRKWVNDPDQADEEFWNNFICRYPEKAQMIEEAKEIVLFLSFDAILPEAADQQSVKAQIFRQISSGKQIHKPLDTYPPLGQTQGHRWSTYYKAAAIFIAIAVCTALFTLLNTQSDTIIRTPYAETKTVLLPDGSTAELNANSTLRFTNNWQRTHKRQVWLTGEAYFDVRKKPEWANATFTVITDRLHVEVLGTTFNVNNRRGKVRVVLNTGKVKLKPAGSSNDTLTMLPKDLVEFTPHSKSFRKKRVNPDDHSAWRNHKLIFTETTLQEIASVLEDNYGLQVDFKEAGLQQRKFTGAIPNQNIDLFLTILAQSLNIEITKSKETVHIHTQ